MNEDELTQEDIDEYNKRRQEEYDEFTKGNEEIRKKQEDDQQLELPLESRKLNPARVGAGLAFEVGANTLLDALTAIPGSQQLGSAAINALAQGIRGGKFSFGEVLASAAASQIPGLSQAKAITKAGKLARAAGQGAVSGAIESTSIAAVDEGRLPTAQEFGLGVGAGGILGAGFNIAGDKLVDPRVTGMFRDLRARINNPQSSFDLAGTVGAAKVNPKGSGDGLSSKGFDPNITKKNLQLFNEIGFTGTNKLDIQDMLYGIDEAGKPLMSQYKRRVLKAGIGDETFNWSNFTENRDAVVKDFLDGLQDLKIDPKTIHGHHISALRITSSLFDGLSPIQRKKLIKIFQREGLQLGNHPDNLMALHKSTHLEVVHPFLEQQIGKYGQLLMETAKIKKLNPRQREGLVKRFAKIIKRSEEIALEDTRTWLDKSFQDLSPEAAFNAKLDMLNKAFDNDVAFRTQLLESVKSKEPILPYQAEDVEIPDTPKTKRRRVTSRKTKFKNILKTIKTQYPDSKQMTIWDISEEALDAYRKLF
tara:strand:- start:51 stop:1652 length:1602 start_codon:yes stop_codon:yes gene_type:complete